MSDTVTVRLPESMIDEIDRLVQSPDSIYKSRSDFVRHAVATELEMQPDTSATALLFIGHWRRARRHEAMKDFISYSVTKSIIDLVRVGEFETAIGAADQIAEVIFTDEPDVVWQKVLGRHLIEQLSVHAPVVIKEFSLRPNVSKHLSALYKLVYD